MVRPPTRGYRGQACPVHKIRCHRSGTYSYPDVQRNTVSAANPDDCARFQREALTRRKNWRKQHPKSKATEECVSANTVSEV